ncbi:MAG TPA: hypothetical protein VFJ47_03045, partial [Terriglobales bacterium]|nr:hypothetical protein [Terriglobales bacterium]
VVGHNQECLKKVKTKRSRILHRVPLPLQALRDNSAGQRDQFGECEVGADRHSRFAQKVCGKLNPFGAPVNRTNKMNGLELEYGSS